VAVITHDPKLNDLLIELGRSLLQYAVESSVYARHDAVARSLAELARAQQGHVARLADLLVTRGWPVDFGGYPTDYTDLHFLSVDYFLPRLAAAQQVLVAELDEAVHTCIDDPAAVDLLRDLHRGEQAIARQLDALAKGEVPQAATAGHAPPLAAAH
jgi:hypothetical protein